MNGKRSNYDQLFITGRRCFYVDPCKDHGIDYFYSWESVFSGFPGSVYVWCRDQLLYSYQKFIIFLLAVLLFTFPVYAEDERYEFQSIQNESLYLQGYDLNQYYNSVNNQKLLNENPDDPSINVYSDEYKFELLEYQARMIDNTHFKGQFTYIGNRPSSFGVLIAFGTNVNPTWYSYSDDRITDNSLIVPVGSSYQPYSISGLRVKYDDYDPIYVDTGNINIDINNLSSSWKSIVSYIGGKMTAYLEQVATVFTWILTHITELITFILGNPFLAVSLVLFMCGAVISFYVRIKNS